MFWSCFPPARYTGTGGGYGQEPERRVSPPSIRNRKKSRSVKAELDWEKECMVDTVQWIRCKGAKWKKALLIVIHGSTICILKVPSERWDRVWRSAMKCGEMLRRGGRWRQRRPGWSWEKPRSGNGERSDPSSFLLINSSYIFLLCCSKTPPVLSRQNGFACSKSMVFWAGKNVWLFKNTPWNEQAKMERKRWKGQWLLMVWRFLACLLKVRLNVTVFGRKLQILQNAGFGRSFSRLFEYEKRAVQGCSSGLFMVK